MNNEVIGVEAAGKRLGISRPTAYKMVRNGILPALRFGRKLVIPKAAIDKMLMVETGSEASK